MAQQDYLVDNISCGHCTNTIESELAELPGVESVQADKDSKVVSVTTASDTAFTAVENLLEEIGFPGKRQ